MDAQTYNGLKTVLLESEQYRKEYEFYQNVPQCPSPFTFFCEYAWVVINSGMKNQIAQKIWEKVQHALAGGRPVKEVFGHPGKAAAIQGAWEDRKRLFSEWREASDKLAYLESLPWIGKITCYHLAKNLGHDCAKPDRHLVRVAARHGTTAEKLCETLASATGDRIASVDYVIWRTANLGKI